MPVINDFAWVQYDDGVLTIGLQPPVPIGGLSFQLTITKRLGGTPITIKSMTSGFYGVSGMQIVNSGQGIMQATVLSSDTSGLDCNNFAYQVRQTDFGANKVVAEGYEVLMP